MDYSKAIAKIAWEIPTTELRFNNPVLWASGVFMPIYNDNRIF